MGNRDINKMRFTSEYTNEELANLSPETPPAFWVPEDKRTTPWEFLVHLAGGGTAGVESVPLEEIRERYCTKANLLRYHLKYDMGSDGDFEFRRQELAHMTERQVDEITDEEVMQSYEDSVAEGGVIREYMQLAELTCLLGPTLFVHGQLIGNFHHGSDSVVAWSVQCVPDGRSHKVVEDLREWVVELNTWAQRSVAEWLAHPTWWQSPKDATYEGWSCRGGAELIAYGTPASKVPSVVYCRWLEENCMPKEYPSELLHFLISEGVQRVVVGHTPHGNCPTVIPHDGLCVIMGDTSYSNMKSDLAFPGDNRGDAVCEISIEDDRCMVRGRTGATAEGRPRQVVHYVVDGHGSGDPHIGVMQRASDSVPLDACFFVKACLPAMEGKDARYLLCKVDGFTNTYQEESPDEVLRVFGSQSVLRKNATTRRRITSHGEEFGASFLGADGDVVEHIFRRLDRDHDGVVTAHELLTACSDTEVRTALQWNFPDAKLEEVFSELDANKDGIAIPNRCWRSRASMQPYGSSLRTSFDVDELHIRPRERQNRISFKATVSVSEVPHLGETDIKTDLWWTPEEGAVR
eukprot:symbB.v1.2.020490.t1/scaffold1730.1/size104407/3